MKIPNIKILSKLWRYPSIFIVLSLFTAVIYAQQPKVISLNQAVGLALENNKLLQAQRQKLNASDWSVKKAYSDFLPRVNLNQRITRVDDYSVWNANIAIEGLKSFPGFEDIDIPPLLFKDTYNTSFGVTMPLFTGGQLTGALELAKIGRESDRLTLRDNEAETELMVTRAYLDYSRSIEYLRAQKVSLELAERNLKNARAKNELGLRPKSDILRWEAQVATEESRIIEMENAVNIAGITLSNVLGADLSQKFEIEIFSDSEFESTRQRYVSASGGNQEEILRGLYEEAVRLNPGKQNISLQKEISGNAVRIARSGFMPQVNFSYNYSWQGNDTPGLDGYKSWDASVTLSYPIFSGFGDVANVKKAKAEQRQTEYLEQDYVRALKVQVFTAFNNLRTQLSKIEFAEKNLIQAEDNLKLIESRYNLGLASNIDLIDSQALESTSQSNLINSRYDFLLAGAELKRVVGKSLINR